MRNRAETARQLSAIAGFAAAVLVLSFLVLRSDYYQLVLTQVLVTSSRKGELAELGGAILFTLIVAFPSNFAAFDPKRNAQESRESEVVR